MKNGYRIRSLRASFSKRGWVWSMGPVRPSSKKSRIQEGLWSQDGSDLLFCGLGSWKATTSMLSREAMTSCQEGGKVQLLTAGPFPSIN